MTRNDSTRVLAVALILTTACAAAEPAAQQTAAVQAVPWERPDWARFFTAWHAAGTFVLHDEQTGATHRYDEQRAAEPFIPASTFKIFNSMAALDAGAVRDIDDVIAWDGVVRNNRDWDQDQRMREAFQRSTVWFYQELARRVGQQRMQALLDREGYGNRSTAGGIDQFWLTGGLRMSADEQIDFLRRLRGRRLGFSARAMDAVEELLVMERGSDSRGEYVLRGKTGWARLDGRHIGWLVGWLERGDRAWFYAMNLDSDDPAFPMLRARPAIVRGILADAALLDPPPAEGRNP